MNKKRVLVGMSGGIDSTATCIMLIEQGYEVIGVTMRTWDIPSKFASSTQEYPDYILEAKELAARLNIEHYVADERETFKDLVVRNFVDEYLEGRTPNPCVVCNPLVKFRVLTEWADRLNCEYIATGHYSQLEDKDNFIHIVVGEDLKKDQSYFLWRLGQDILKRCIFPLGSYTKKQVREYLKQKDFVTKAEEGESMEICFIDGDYRNFLKEQVSDWDSRIGKGAFVNSQGVKLGEHKGYPYYTVGQRKGLELALGYPAYVLKLNPAKNTVMVGKAEELITIYMLIESFLPVNPNEFFNIGDLTVRIRYHGDPIPCKVSSLEDGRFLVHFRKEASAVTPGQSAVFYEGKRVVGGAFIASQRGIGMYIPQEKTIE